MNPKEQIARLQNRIDELTLRERGILFLVVVILLFFLTDKLLISPQEQQQKQLLGSIGKLRTEITTLEQQKLQIIQNHTNDPNSAELEKLANIQQASARIEQQIAEAVDGLIEPEEMARALEGVLKEQRELRFVRISNLGATPLLATETTGGETEADTDERAAIYKHTMRIELEGSFLHTRDYLGALEQLPWRFHWESVELEMLEYPLSRVVITVNTLSLSEGWIGV